MVQGPAKGPWLPACPQDKRSHPATLADAAADLPASTSIMHGGVCPADGACFFHALAVHVAAVDTLALAPAARQLHAQASRAVQQGHRHGGMARGHW